MPTRLLLSILTAFTTCSAQISRIEPHQPRQGESIIVTYDPSAEGAKLGLHDEVYASAAVFSDTPNARVLVKLNRTDKQLQGKLSIGPEASYLKLSFITRHDCDPKADLSTIIYRQDGVPACGAFHFAIFDRNSDAVELARKEVELYPDDFAVYPDKWAGGGMVMKKEEKLAMIQKDMAAISATPHQESVDWLYAMSSGYLTLGNESQARELLSKMVERFPTSPLTWHLVDLAAYFAKNPQYKSEAAKWRRDLIKRFPASPLARGISNLVEQQDFPLAATQTVVQNWTEQEPKDPDAYLAFGTACITHHQNYQDAHAALERAIQLLMAGEYMGGCVGTLTQNRLYRAYRDQAEIFLEERNFPQALAAAKAAEAFERDNQGRGQILEGKVWQANFDNARAEAAYLEAWHRDSEQGEIELKRFYQESRGNLDGFSQYLDAHKPMPSTNEEEKKKLAPSFQAVSLDGEKLSLDALRGKVIVLNFWFVGCPPCMSEIPTLNRWVQEFKDRGVVFVAFALNHPAELRAFLKKVPFSYKVVPDAIDIATSFAVPTYPTHILINQRGEIVLKLAGDESPSALETRLRDILEGGSQHQ